MSRTILRVAVIALAALGVAITVIVFASSWRPTRHAHDLAIVLDEPSPTPGTYLTRDPTNLPNVRLLLVAAPSGELSAFALPLQGGKVVLPDIHWWRAGALCIDFRSESISGAVVDSSIFECHDSPVKEWSGVSWRWTISGKNVPAPGTMPVDDLTQVAFVEENARVRVHRKDIRW